MKLKEGQLAPDFSATDLYGNAFKLSDFRGKKIILSFYRNVACPFCNRRVHQIMGKNVWLKQKGDVQLLFFFESAPEKLRASVFHQGISPWPLVGDPQKQVYRTYGVESSLFKMLKTLIVANPGQASKELKHLDLPARDPDSSGTLIPADFFIGEDFRIVRAHYGQHLDDHVPLPDLLAFAGVNI